MPAIDGGSSKGTLGTAVWSPGIAATSRRRGSGSSTTFCNPHRKGLGCPDAGRKHPSRFGSADLDRQAVTGEVLLASGAGRFSEGVHEIIRCLLDLHKHISK